VHEFRKKELDQEKLKFNQIGPNSKQSNRI